MYKALIALSFLSLSLSSFASSPRYGEVMKPGTELLSLKCVASGEGLSNYRITVRASTASVYEENAKIPAKITVAKSAPLPRIGMPRPVVKEGYYSFEDVQVFFKSYDKQLKLNAYMDELDQTTLTYKSGAEKKLVRLNCN